MAIFQRDHWPDSLCDRADVDLLLDLPSRQEELTVIIRDLEEPHQ